MAMLPGASLIQAGETETALQLSLKDGSRQTYVLSEKPVITFGTDNLTITTPEASASCLRSEVESFRFVAKPISGITVASTGNSIFRYDGNTVEVAGSLIRLHDTAGRLVATGMERVSLENLASGIYIATFENQSVKIIKK